MAIRRSNARIPSAVVLVALISVACGCSSDTTDRFKNVPPMAGQDPNGPIDTALESVPGGSHTSTGLPEQVSDESPERAKNSLPVHFVTKDFQLAAVIQIQQLLKTEIAAAALETAGMSLDTLESESGLPLSEVERVILLVNSLPMANKPGPPPPPITRPPADRGGEGDEPVNVEEELFNGLAEEELSAEQPEFQFAAVVQLSGSTPAKDVMAGLASTLPGQWQSTSVAGKPCLVTMSAGPGPNCLCELDSQTLIISQEDVVAAMIGADGSGPLAECLSTVDLDNDLVVTATPGLLPEGLTDGIKDSIIPQLNALATLPDNLTSASLGVRLSSSPRIHLELNAKSKAAAATAQIAVKSIVSLLELMVPQLKKQLEMDPSADAMALDGLAMAETLIKAIEVGREGATTSITVALPEEALQAGMELVSQSMNAAQGQARQLSNLNNLKQIGLSVWNHHFEYKKYPVGEDERIQFKDGKPLLSWRVHLLPFLDQQALYDEFHLDEPWDSEHNKTLLEKMPPFYVDQKNPLPSGMTNYLAPGTESSILGGTSAVKQADVVDGMTNTILVMIVAPEKAVPWTKPADLSVDEDDPVGSLGEFPDGSISVLFGDGSVKPISLSIESDVLLHLFDKRDGNPLNPADLP